MKMGGGEDPGRCGRRFPLLGVAATTREDAGDGSKHRLGYVVLGMGVMGVDTAGIEGKSCIFRRVCLICRKSALLLGQLLVALPDASFVARAIVVCWECPSLAMRDSSSVVERLRIPRGRKLESAVVLVACSTYDPSIISLNARPPRLLLALHRHIETFSKVPKRHYRLFDAFVSLGPFSSGCHRTAAFVTRMGNFIQIWSDLGLVIFRVL
ncbi:hypothetical protein CDL15_Pgr012278 [Punica granatum]|uniref:Uncharacterized protein n=1 Tax=Punica granatum TaxID=22663 RepID=A0A218WS63_PUNGR|nr:hypothetical protein CDL15_Pgr012278 [Punica granatum]